MTGSSVVLRRVFLNCARQSGQSTIGVDENEEQKQFLLTQNCDIFQGYYFAKPMRDDAFEKVFFESKVDES